MDIIVLLKNHNCIIFNLKTNFCIFHFYTVKKKSCKKKKAENAFLFNYKRVFQRRQKNNKILSMSYPKGNKGEFIRNAKTLFRIKVILRVLWKR